MTAFCILQLAVLLIRGPHVSRYTWFGYTGGMRWRRFETRAQGADEESASASADDETRAPSLEVDRKDEKDARLETVACASDVKSPSE